MVPLACGLPLLLDQSIRKGGTLEYSDSCCGYDDRLLAVKVSIGRRVHKAYTYIGID